MSALTNDVRRVIRDRVLEHAFGKKEQELAEARKKLSDEVYEAHFPKEVRELMEKLPTSVIPEAHKIVARPSGLYVELELARPRRLPQFYSITPTGSLGEAVEDLIHATRRLGEERRAKTKEIDVVLESVRSVKRLLEVWPEIEEFVADLKGEKVVTSLAVPIKSLNRELGLPPGTTPVVESISKKSVGKKAVSRVR